MNQKNAITFTAIMMLFLGTMLISCTESQQEVGEEVATDKSVPKEDAVAIADIINNKDAYQDKDVVVSGKVIAGLAFEFVGEQPYQLQDGDDRLWVITSGIVPEEGATVTVRGRVIMPYQIKGRRYDVVLLEAVRK